MVRYLITGANGFIGSNFIKYLREQNPKAEIVGISKDKFEIDGIERIELDIASPSAIDKICKIAPERIFHFAGATGTDNWETLFSSNVLTTINVLEATRQIKTEGKKIRVFVIGSAAEYGMPVKLPVTEEMASRPITNYALSMVFRRIVVESFVARGCWVVNGRLFNPLAKDIGQNQAPGAFIRQVRMVKNGMQKEVIVGSLDVKRDFIDMDDVCRAVDLICEKGKVGETYNICSGESHSLGEVLELIIKENSVKIRVVIDPKKIRVNDVKDIYGSYKKIQADVGWTPKISFEESIRKMVKSPS